MTTTSVQKAKQAEIMFTKKKTNENKASIRQVPNFLVRGELYVRYLARQLPESVFDYLIHAMKGDKKAAECLAVWSSSSMRPDIIRYFWEANGDASGFSVLLQSVWEMDHVSVICAANTRKRLQLFFQYARFSPPSELPNIVRVWRGGSGKSLKQLSDGLAWTTDRDVACWFAMRFGHLYGSPIVISAEVKKTEISLYTNTCNESEVVLFNIATPNIDGDVSDWAEGHAAVMKKTKSSLVEAGLGQLVGQAA